MGRKKISGGVDMNEISETRINVILHRYLLQTQKGKLYPDAIPVQTMERVLDLGCGTGEWLFDLAKQQPKLHMYGLDIDQRVLHQAIVRRNAGSMRKVELRHIDPRFPLPLPDESVDFVHMQGCSRFIAPENWPYMIAEGIRVLKPEGWMMLIELDLGNISGSACQALLYALRQTLENMRLALHNEAMPGLTQHLYGMLLDASLEDVRYDLHTIDLGFKGASEARLLLSQFVQSALIIKPLIVQQGIYSTAEFDRLVVEAEQELYDPDLCGWAMLVSAYGRKPKG